jgi:ribosomal protein S12 methylthiotransferase
MERSSIPKPTPPKSNLFQRAIVVNLGCPKNLVETERVCHLLTSNGVSIVSENDLFDAIFINSCCFLKASRTETRELIAKYYTDSALTIVVFGCYASRYTTELKKLFPHLVLISDPDPCQGIHQHFFANKLPTFFSRSLSNPYTAYLKIAEGCDRACSFCLIPSIKGSFKSFTPSSLLQEVEKLCEVYPLKELVIVAQDTSSYGKDFNSSSATNLINLLSSLDKASFVPWIRILYLFPSLDFSFLDELYSIPSILPYLDMPLQHIDPQVLRLMNRPTNIDTTLLHLEQLRKHHKEMIFRSTFIVGFPGENQKQFDKLCDFIVSFKYQRAGFFAYSDEIDAPSYFLSNKIPPTEAEQRLKTIYELQNQISYEYHQTLIGKTLPVLAESWNGVSRKLTGRSYWDAPDIDYKVSVSCSSPKDANKLGQIVPVKMTSLDGMQLKGAMLE